MSENNAIVKVNDDLLKRYIFGAKLANKISKNDAMLFMEIAKASNLNPFKREIYFVEYKNEVKFLTGYEVYLKRAEDTGLLDGWTTEFSGKDNSLVCKITIWRKDRQYPFTHEVFFEEYNQDNFIWKTKPRTMLKKVAMSQGFRLCFPKHLGGMPYTSDEMGGDGNVVQYVDHEEKHTSAQPTHTTPQEEPEAETTLPPPQEEATAPVAETQPEVEEQSIEEPQPATPAKPSTATHKTFAKTSSLPPEKRMQRYCEECRFPFEITEMAEELDFQYGHSTIPDYYVPLPMAIQKKQQHRQVFLATHIFPNGDSHKGIPLYRGFLCALSKEPKQSYWTTSHYESYTYNYAKLMAGAGNLGYQETDEQNPDAVSDVFRAFAANIARQQIDTVLAANHIWKDDRITLAMRKDIVHIYMDYFLPLPIDTDPNFTTMCLYRQLISGGRDGAGAGTAMLDGKITKNQANRFWMNMVYALIGKQKTIDSILQGEGWNILGLPNIGPRNLSIVAPILANLAKRIKDM